MSEATENATPIEDAVEVTEANIAFILFQKPNGSFGAVGDLTKPFKVSRQATFLDMKIASRELYEALIREEIAGTVVESLKNGAQLGEGSLGSLTD
jgi:hypothetical protein